LGDLGAVCELRRALAEERAQQAGVRGVLDRREIVQAVDQRGQSERVGQQNELLPLGRALLAYRGHELDALEPFGRGQVHLAREGVHVLHGRRHDRLEAGVGRGGHLLEDGLGDRLRGQLVHIVHRVLHV
jgi:hypothetical protein